MEPSAEPGAVGGDRIGQQPEQPRAPDGSQPPSGFSDAVLRWVSTPMLVVSPEATVTWVSPGFQTTYDDDAQWILGTNVLEHIHPDDQGVVVEGMAYALSRPDDPLLPLVARIVTRTYGTRWCELRSHDASDDPELGGFLVVLADVTERALLNVALEAIVEAQPIERTFGLLADQSRELTKSPTVIQWSSDDRRLQVTSGSDALDPRLLPQAAGGDATSPWDRVQRTDAAELLVAAGDLDEPARSGAAEAGFRALWLARVTFLSELDGQATIGMWLRNTDPSPGRRQSLARTTNLVRLALERHQAERQLRHAALHDPLTGLANRTEFFDRLRTLLRTSTGVLGVLYLDLDEFKDVNDRAGHAVGDEVLRVVAKRITAAVRPGDCVARLGGDELAVICPGLHDVEETQRIARRLIEAISTPIAVAGSTVVVSASIGIGTTGNLEETDEDALVDAADRALYEAKQAGRSTWRLAGDG